ncbi:helix-turn-helix domain-containing protein [Paraburkholderia sp. 2C]
MATHPIHNPRYQRVSILLTELRQAKELTQQEVASRLDKPQSFISKIENGERRVDVIELLEILHVLGVDPHKFIDQLLKSAPIRSLPR